jgi:hypothetical protein
MKKTRALQIWFALAMMLSACSSPQTSSEATSAPASEATSTPAERPVATATSIPAEPEPTATPALQAQAIDPSNIASLEPVKTQELPLRTLAIQDDYNEQDDEHWNTIQWTLDGKSLVVATTSGIEVLDGTSLETTQFFPGLKPVDLLTDGGLIALSGNQAFKLNLGTGERTDLGAYTNMLSEVASIDTKIMFDDMFGSDDTDSNMLSEVASASRDGKFLVYVTGENTVDLVNLSDNTTESITLERSLAITEIINLTFSPDSSQLLVTAIVRDDEWRRVVSYSVSDFSKPLYEFITNSAFVLSSDSAMLAYDRVNELDGRVRETDTGEEVGGFGVKLETDFSNLAATSFDFADSSTILGLYIGGTSTEAGGRLSKLSSFLIDTEFLTGKILNQYELESDALAYPMVIRVNPNSSKQYAIVHGDGTIRLYEHPSHTLLTTSKRYGTTGAPTLNPNGESLLLSYVDEVKVLSTNDLAVQTSFSPLRPDTADTTAFYPHAQFISEQAIAISIHRFDYENSDAIYAGYYFPSLRQTTFYNLETGAEIRTVSAQPCTTDFSATIAACLRIAALSGDQNVDVYDIQSDKIHVVLPQSTVTYYAVTTNGPSLTTCRTGGDQILLTNYENGEVTRLDFPCQDMKFLPDGALLLADGTLVDVEAGSANGSLALTQTFVELPYIYAPVDQGWILVGDSIYDLNTGQQIATLEASHIISAAMSSDQTTLYLITDNGLESWQVLQ